MPWETSNRREELRAIKNSRGETWENIRERILKRDKRECQAIRQGRQCLRFANQVDHIEPGNNHEDENLQSLCAVCHKRKSSAEGYAARKRNNKRPEPRHPGLLT